MELIKLTVYKRRNVLVNEERALDVDAIISPIRVNADDKSYFTYRTKLPTGLPGDLVDYQADEDLDAIKAMSAALIKLTVTSRDSRPLTVGGVTVASEEMIFNANKVAEGFQPSGSGATFLYCEDGDSTPVPYVVTETVDNIYSQSETGGGGGGGSQSLEQVLAIGNETGSEDIILTNGTPGEILVLDNDNKIVSSGSSIGSADISGDTGKTTALLDEDNWNVDGSWGYSGPDLGFSFGQSWYSQATGYEYRVMYDGEPRRFNFVL